MPASYDLYHIRPPPPQPPHTGRRHRCDKTRSALYIFTSVFSVDDVYSCNPYIILYRPILCDNNNNNVATEQCAVTARRKGESSKSIYNNILGCIKIVRTTSRDCSVVLSRDIRWSKLAGKIVTSESDIFFFFFRRNSKFIRQLQTVIICPTKFWAYTSVGSKLDY